MADIPRIRSGKIAELAVLDVVHGRPVSNKDALPSLWTCSETCVLATWLIAFAAPRQGEPIFSAERHLGGVSRK